MKVYVAAPVGAVDAVRAMQDRLLAAGHELTFGWTQDLSLVSNFASQADRSAEMASVMIEAVCAAQAVVMLATELDGRGMFVELGAALAHADDVAARRVVVVGEITHESVSYLHPRVRRCTTVDECLAVLAA